jgi:hypothetical protein
MLFIMQGSKEMDKSPSILLGWDYCPWPHEKVRCKVLRTWRYHNIHPPPPKCQSVRHTYSDFWLFWRLEPTANGICIANQDTTQYSINAHKTFCIWQIPKFWILLKMYTSNYRMTQAAIWLPWKLSTFYLGIFGLLSIIFSLRKS